MHQLTFIIQTSCVKTKNYYLFNRSKLFDTNNIGAMTIQHIKTKYNKYNLCASIGKKNF